MRIREVMAREVLDSRGNPTIEVELAGSGYVSRAIVPSGASTGKHEAHELRDGGKRYHGKGVKKAIRTVTNLSSEIRGKHPQNELDSLLVELDGTPTKKKLGANALLGVSLAAARLGAMQSKQPLYVHLGKLYGNTLFSMPQAHFNILNGGMHSDSSLAIQEFMIVPKARKFSEQVRMASETYHTLKKILHKKYGAGSTNVGDEGGFALAALTKTSQALTLLKSAIRRAGYTTKTTLALDVAATSFYRKGSYHLDGKTMSPKQLLTFYQKLVETYPISSIEDPFHEEAFADYASLRKYTTVVGDDLTVTNSSRIDTAIAQQSCDTLLLKVNQVGTLSEALMAAKKAQNAGWNLMVSHRSGETEDSFIADLAVGIGAQSIKAGAPARGERVAKYNQLLRISEHL